MKKSIIDTYLTIYYVDIVVANKYTTLEQLQELYEFTNGDPLDECLVKSEASTSYVRRKSDNKDCVLVKYNHNSRIKSIDNKVAFINTISHEAGHVALDIYERIDQNICFCTPEPFCYLLGYAAECIYKTLKKTK